MNYNFEIHIFGFYSFVGLHSTESVLIFYPASDFVVVVFFT